MAQTESGGLLVALSNDIAGAVERAGRSTVTVHGRGRLPGTGIVWQPGVVVTADHVLERDEDVTVSIGDGQKVAATVAGRDPGSDLAILKVDGIGEPAEQAPSGSIKVGHFVLALGRPGTNVAASFGVVSAVGESWRTARGGVVEGYIRADVSLYPGFSGGPLVDGAGRVAGLNSSHLARGQEIAIPAAAVSAVVQTLLTHGKIQRGYLGITSRPVRLTEQLQQKLGVEQASGLLIMGVEPESPAEKGGLMIGDVLVAVGGTPTTDSEDLQVVLGPGTVGTAIEVMLLRGGERATVHVTPGSRD
ncbi:MAG: hypothetical protein QOF51_3259 [Chloroflexota bacterium]|jgi:S1-C subfamily serine protease|nr:hypothetical protein [Chloroflexota bacterium]